MVPMRLIVISCLLTFLQLVCPSLQGAESPLAVRTNLAWKSGTHQLGFDGRERTFLIDVPKKLRSKAPLLLIFHGFGNSAKGIRDLTGFAPLAEKYGFVAVYPEGTHDSKGKQFFNVGYQFHQDQKVDDIQFVKSLSARLVNDLGLDARSVFATGFSNGGDMSFFLGAQRDPFVAAIAPVAGTMMNTWTKNFKPAVRLSVMAVNAPQDKITLWSGDMQNRDGWGAYLGTEAVVNLWIKGLELTQSNRVDFAKTIRLNRWPAQNDPTEVRLYLIGGGHNWPQNLGVEKETTAEVIWRFFDSHRPKTP
ncbi:MAG: hypothetical protein EXS25_05060 [Pedosphaera sp.]|nr:hypothetical protein [Pedosphaera sp.]